MRQFHMPPEAFTADPLPGDTIRLPADESKHLLRVLRAEAGAEVLVTDGRGRRIRTVLREARPPEAGLEVLAVEQDEAELAAPRLVLACGVIKGKRWEWLLEKATELGVHRIVPLLSRYAEVDPGSGRRRRWETVLQSAVKQSGRSWRPTLDDPVTPGDYLAEDARRLVCYGLARSRTDEPGASSLLDPRDLADPEVMLPGAAGPPDEIVWCVGPEGGWNDEEIERLHAVGRAVRLGPHRLRAETAGMAGLLPLASLRERLILDRTAGAVSPAEVNDGDG